MDPAADAAPGFDEAQRDRPNGFTGDADVLDTWATSSLTPQIVGGWSRDEDLFAKVYPFDLRPQGHDIIRTWLFSSAVRADALQNIAPWKHAAISGWILDPDRKKMSKSKGNVVVPTDVLDEFGSDAVRYWAASAKLGRRHGLRDRADEDRPPPGHQAAERLQVRAEPGRHRELGGLH